MIRYTIRRLLQGALAIIGAITIVFFILRLSGDPARLMLPPEASQEQVDAMRETLGFTRPLWQQYLDFLGDTFTGNFGDSLYYGSPALSLVLERLPATLILAVVAILLSVLVGMTVGVISAHKKNTPLDYMLTGVVLFGQSMPVFWVAVILIFVFAESLRWLPTSGFDGPLSLILPAVALSFYSAAPIARTTRASMITVLDQNYITAAIAQGFSPRQVLIGKALKNSLLPVITIIGLEFGTMVGGAVVSETVFAWPGVGRLIMDAIGNRDFPLAQVCVLVLSVVFILINIVIDLLYTYIDPRIQADWRAGKTA